MANEKTRADSVRYYQTGASSDAATQSNPDVSLGGFRSATLCQFLAAAIASPMGNVTVDFTAGGNGVGDGTLTAASTNSLTWTPPGTTAGTPVTIASGETKVLEGGGADGAVKYIRVTRTSTADLTGTATLTLSYVLNNVVGMDNVAGAQALAGDAEYRCICLRNEHNFIAATKLLAYIATLGTQRVSDTGSLPASGAGTISTSASFADWPASGFTHIKNAGTTREIVYYASRTDTVLTIPAAGRGRLGTVATAGDMTDTVDAVPGLRVAFETPSSGTGTTGSVQLIADENTAPVGLTWSNATTPTGAATHTSLGIGEIIYLWLHRDVAAGTQPVASQLYLINISFDSL